MSHVTHMNESCHVLLRNSAAQNGPRASAHQYHVSIGDVALSHAWGPCVVSHRCGIVALAWLMPHSASHCNILDYSATYCNTLLPTAIHCNRARTCVTHGSFSTSKSCIGFTRHVAHEYVMSHTNTSRRTRIRHVAHEYVTSHTSTSCRTRIRHVAHKYVTSHTNTSCRTRIRHVAHEYVMSRIRNNFNQHGSSHATDRYTAEHCNMHCNTGMRNNTPVEWAMSHALDRNAATYCNTSTTLYHTNCNTGMHENAPVEWAMNHESAQQRHNLLMKFSKVSF